MRKASRGRCWWEAPATQLGLQEVEQLKEAMEELKKNININTIDSKIPGFGLL